MWNWIKINEVKDLPDFNKVVLLYQQSADECKYVSVGYLKSIDADGFHWSYCQSSDFLSEIFTLSSRPKKENFKPTHWCEIEDPKE
jgi:hypothetical protein